MTKEILDKYTLTEDINLKELLAILAKRTKNRIQKFIELDVSNWLYSDDEREKKNKIINDLLVLNDNTETQIHELITAIGKEASVIKIIFDEYVKLEQNQIEALMISFSKSTRDIYLQTGLDYPNFISSIINEVIEKYNQNLETINKFQGDIPIEKLSNNYKQIFEVIRYSDISDKIFKVQEVLDRIIRKGNCGAITIFLGSGDKLKGLKPPNHVQILDFSEISGEIALFLEAIYETIDKESLIQFYPQLQKNHALILCALTQKEKTVLSNLQLRSNLACYFFEKL